MRNDSRRRPTRLGLFWWPEVVEILASVFFASVFCFPVFAELSFPNRFDSLSELWICWKTHHGLSHDQSSLNESKHFGNEKQEKKTEASQKTEASIFTVKLTGGARNSVPVGRGWGASVLDNGKSF